MVRAASVVRPFGQWAPDRPAIAVGASREARNVTPIADGYEPFPALVTASAALAERCTGLVSVRGKDGGARRFAAGTSKLYRLDGAAWVDVSKSGGYSSTPPTRWRFAPFGDRLVGVSFENATQYYDVSTGSAFADLPNAPRSRYVASYLDFLLLGHLTTSTIAVGWSGFNNTTQWTAGSNQSDVQELPDGGSVTGLAVADAAYVFQEQAIRRLVYTGPPTIMQVDVVERGRGCVEANSLAQLGRRMFYLSDDGFQMFDGVVSVGIGVERVDKWFRAHANRALLYRMSAAVDPKRKLVLWAFPSVESPSGAPDTILIYHIDVDRWSYATQALELLAALTTVGYTLEQLDDLAAPFGGIENYPISPDDPSLAGGVSIFGAVNSAQELAYFLGAPLEALIETDDVEFGQGRTQFLTGLRPLIDVACYAQSGVRLRAQDAVTWKGETLTNGLGVAPQRATARYARARVRIPAGASWTSAQGVELMTQPGGVR